MPLLFHVVLIIITNCVYMCLKILCLLINPPACASFVNDLYRIVALCDMRWRQRSKFMLLF